MWHSQLLLSAGSKAGGEDFPEAAKSSFCFAAQMMPWCLCVPEKDSEDVFTWASCPCVTDGVCPI